MSLPQKTSWIGTSWKMHKTLAESSDYAMKLATADIDPLIQPFVIPPFTSLREVCSRLADSRVLVGAQNMHWEPHGAWTGEISAPMLKDCGAKLVEIGHSERREHFGETNTTVGLKVRAALEHGLIPIICIGETLQERNAGRASSVLSEQVKAALEHIASHPNAERVLFAYEPVWAIGENGLPAESSYANTQQAQIIAEASAILNMDVPCLYGGSVNPDNCEELITCSHIDGLFIGRSAWQIGDYLDILSRCTTALKRTQHSANP